MDVVKQQQQQPQQQSAFPDQRPPSATSSTILPPLALEGIRASDLNVALLDVESLNPGYGPLRAIGIVLASYRRSAVVASDDSKSASSEPKPLFEVRHRAQWIIRRSYNEFDADGLRFWKDKAASADRFFDTCPISMDAADAARSFRQYIDALWSGVPGICLMIDDRHTDGVLLNQFLAQHSFWPIQYDGRGVYQPYVYVSRDLMRGAFGAICPAYADLRKSDLYRAIHAYWNRLRSASYEPITVVDPVSKSPIISTENPTTTVEPARNGGILFGPAAPERDPALGPETKHVPVYDSLQALSVFFLLEDAKRLFAAQLARLPAGVLCLPA
jgi:hypothetical protein